VARAWHQALTWNVGTFDSMLSWPFTGPIDPRPDERENPKWQIHEGESTDASQGTDRFVVAMKPRNGGRAKGPGCSEPSRINCWIQQEEFD